MKNNENNSANNFELAPAAAPPASAAVVAAETATAAGNAANEAQNQAVAAALAATEAQNQARTLAAGAAAADVAKAAAEAALKYANKPIKLEHFPKSPEEPQTKIGQIKKCLNWIKELATKKRDDKFLGWFAGSSRDGLHNAEPSMSLRANDSSRIARAPIQQVPIRLSAHCDRFCIPTGCLAAHRTHSGLRSEQSPARHP